MMRPSIVLLAPLIAACVESPGLGTQTSEIASCPKWGCNENSPLMTTVGYFHDLHPRGVPNQQGMSVIDYRLPNSSEIYRPRIVDGSRLVIDNDDNSVTLSGHDLEGGWFEIQSGYGVHRLFIEHVTTLAESQVRFWVGASTPIETYTLTYQEPGQALGPKRQVLCNNAPPYDKSGGTVQGAWVNPLEAFFFTGDRYDADQKTVTKIDDTSDFFNIACAGSAIAKLHLNRHTSLGSPGPYGETASQAKRQAMLKMYVSDVCGNGSAWTMKGTPLRFSDSAHWFTFSGPAFAHEAYWDESGATCLDVHRLGALFEDEINAQCRRSLPACSRFTSAGTYFSSWVPFPI